MPLTGWWNVASTLSSSHRSHTSVQIPQGRVVWPSGCYPPRETLTLAEVECLGKYASSMEVAQVHKGGWSAMPGLRAESRQQQPRQPQSPASGVHLECTLTGASLPLEGTQIGRLTYACNQTSLQPAPLRQCISTHPIMVPSPSLRQEHSFGGQLRG